LVVGWRRDALQRLWVKRKDGILYNGLALMVRSGAGKSNILLHLLLAVQLPESVGGLDGAAVYISTEGRPPTNRLSQLNHAFNLKFPEANVSMDRVFCNDVRGIDILEYMVRYQLPVLIEKHNIRLIVIDSIAAPFRAEASEGKSLRDPAALAKRSRQLVTLGQLLRNLAIKYDLVVLAANQVSDKFSRNENPSSQFSTQAASQYSNSPYNNNQDDDVMMLDYQARWFTGWEQIEGGKVPALGMSWTNCLAARIALYRKITEELNEEDDIVEKIKRSMRVVFAPWVQGGRELEYVIETAGIRGIQPSKPK
jgi:DNA repair protein RAD57